MTLPRELLAELGRAARACKDARRTLDEQDPLCPAEGYSGRVERAEKLARIEDAISDLLSLEGLR